MEKEHKHEWSAPVLSQKEVDHGFLKPKFKFIYAVVSCHVCGEIKTQPVD